MASTPPCSILTSVQQCRRPGSHIVTWEEDNARDMRERWQILHGIPIRDNNDTKINEHARELGYTAHTRLYMVHEGEALQ